MQCDQLLIVTSKCGCTGLSEDLIVCTARMIPDVRILDMQIIISFIRMLNVHKIHTYAHAHH